MKIFTLLVLLALINFGAALAQEMKSSSDFFEHGYANVADPKRNKPTTSKDTWSVPPTQTESLTTYPTPQPNSADRIRKPFSPRPLPQSRNNTFELGRVDRDENGY